MDETTTKQVWFEMVDEKEVPQAKYNGCKFQDGKLICFTTPKKFGRNCSDIFDGLEDKL